LKPPEKNIQVVTKCNGFKIKLIFGRQIQLSDLIVQLKTIFKPALKKGIFLGIHGSEKDVRYTGQIPCDERIIARLVSKTNSQSER